MVREVKLSLQSSAVMSKLNIRFSQMNAINKVNYSLIVREIRIEFELYGKNPKFFGPEMSVTFNFNQRTIITAIIDFGLITVHVFLG